MRSRRFGLRAHEWGVLIVCVVVVGSIGCMGMSRSPNRRNQCSVQVKNLAYAALIYENTHGQFPGYVMDFGTFTAGDVPVDPTDPNADTSTLVSHRKIGPWTVALLASLDAQAVHEHWTEDRYPIAFGGSEKMPLSSGEAGIGFTMIAAPNLPIFLCPDSPAKDTTHGRNNYICNAGMHFGGDASEGSWRIARGEEEIAVDFERSMSAANGVFNNKVPGLDAEGNIVVVGPRITIDDFKDGQGNTALFSESLQAMPWHRAGFIDASDLVATEGETVMYEPTSRYTQGMVWHYEDDRVEGVPPVAPVHRINGVPAGADLISLRMTKANAADLARPSSAHTEGVNMAMADGTTRFVSDSIDYRVYQALLTLSGRKSDVPDPSYVLKPDSL